MAEGALKLRAEDEEDLAVFSSVLQDALVPVAEMAWLPDERRFALVANRFRWDKAGAEPRMRSFERTLCGVLIDEVNKVQRRGLSLSDPDRILALLAIRVAGNELVLDFAGGAAIRLEVERIACRLDDLGEPWPTRWRPRHPA